MENKFLIRKSGLYLATNEKDLTPSKEQAMRFSQIAAYQRAIKDPECHLIHEDDLPVTEKGSPLSAPTQPVFTLPKPIPPYPKFSII